MYIPSHPVPSHPIPSINRNVTHAMIMLLSSSCLRAALMSSLHSTTLDSEHAWLITRHTATYPYTSPFARTPLQVITHILAHLPRRDILRARYTCYALHHASHQPAVWHLMQLCVTLPHRHLVSLMHSMHGCQTLSAIIAVAHDDALPALSHTRMLAGIHAWRNTLHTLCITGRGLSAPLTDERMMPITKLHR